MQVLALWRLTLLTVLGQSSPHFIAVNDLADEFNDEITGCNRLAGYQPQALGPHLRRSESNHIDMYINPKDVRQTRTMYKYTHTLEGQQLAS